MKEESASCCSWLQANKYPRPPRNLRQTTRPYVEPIAVPIQTRSPASHKAEEQPTTNPPETPPKPIPPVTSTPPPTAPQPREGSIASMQPSAMPQPPEANPSQTLSGSSVATPAESPVPAERGEAPMDQASQPPPHQEKGQRAPEAGTKHSAWVKPPSLVCPKCSSLPVRLHIFTKMKGFGVLDPMIRPPKIYRGMARRLPRCAARLGDNCQAAAPLIANDIQAHPTVHHHFKATLQKWHTPSGQLPIPY